MPSDDDIILKLNQDLDVSNRDAYGPDPFHFRDNPIVSEQEPLTLTDLLSHYAATSLPIEDSNYDETKPNRIPNIGHFNYVIRPIISVYEDTEQNLALRTICTFKETNPTYNVLLWVERAAYTDKNWQRLLDWAQEHRIHLLDRSIFSNRLLEYEGLINFVSRLQRIGQISDFLRHFPLIYFGGFYTDTDVVAVKPLGDIEVPAGIIFRNGFAMSDKPHPLERDYFPMERKFGANNDLIGATAHNPISYMNLAAIKERFKLSFEELLRKSDDTTKRRDPASYNSSSYMIKLTMMLTGPDVTYWLIKSLPEDEKYAYLRDTTDFLTHFQFGSEVSWMQSDRNAFPEKIECVKCIISGILFDLNKDPHTLRLGCYTAFYHDNSLEIAIELLRKNYPEVLKKITTLYTEELDFPHELFTNQDIFPALDMKDVNEQFYRRIIARGDSDRFHLIPTNFFSEKQREAFFVRQAQIAQRNAIAIAEFHLRQYLDANKEALSEGNLEKINELFSLCEKNKKHDLPSYSYVIDKLLETEVVNPPILLLALLGEKVIYIGLKQDLFFREIKSYAQGEISVDTAKSFYSNYHEIQRKAHVIEDFGKLSKNRGPSYWGIFNPSTKSPIHFKQLPDYTTLRKQLNDPEFFEKSSEEVVAILKKVEEITTFNEKFYVLSISGINLYDDMTNGFYTRYITDLANYPKLDYRSKYNHFDELEKIFRDIRGFCEGNKLSLIVDVSKLILAYLSNLDCPSETREHLNKLITYAELKITELAAVEPNESNYRHMNELYTQFTAALALLQSIIFNTDAYDTTVKNIVTSAKKDPEFNNIYNLLMVERTPMHGAPPSSL